MDTVRKQEQREYKFLKGQKYSFLSNPENLSEEHKDALEKLCIAYPSLGEAYRLKVWFNELWTMPTKASAKIFIEQWCRDVELSNIQPFMKFARTIKAHLTGIINYVETNITNAILESINSKIQMAKRRARGFRNTDNFINMIYFHCGKLKFNYPLYRANC